MSERTHRSDTAGPFDVEASFALLEKERVDMPVVKRAPKRAKQTATLDV